MNLLKIIKGYKKSDIIYIPRLEMSNINNIVNIIDEDNFKKIYSSDNTIMIEYFSENSLTEKYIKVSLNPNLNHFFSENTRNIMTVELFHYIKNMLRNKGVTINE